MVECMLDSSRLKQPWETLVERMADNLLVYMLERPPISVHLHNSHNLPPNLDMKLKFKTQFYCSFLTNNEFL